MVARYRGSLGEYMWQKDMQRLERYKDRPWELQSRSQIGGELFVLAVVCIGGLAGLLLLSLF
jgi:hypothetical protein